MEKRKISRKRRQSRKERERERGEESARNFSKIIEMSRSNFSNCKNPDAVVQCAVRIDRATQHEVRRGESRPEGGGEGQALHLSPAGGRGGVGEGTWLGR